jgi:hypothetical protein
MERGFIILETISRRLVPGPRINTAEVCARLSRLLLLLMAVELITMPLTQHFWTWDGFLHGGPDFETGLFMIVVCLCLVLLRAQHGQQRIPLLLPIRMQLFLALGRQCWRPTQIDGFATSARQLPSNRPQGVVTLPLLI